MATIEQLSSALVNADNAGDVEAARALAAEITRMRAAASARSPQQPQAANQQAPQFDGGMAGAAALGAADTASFGFGDELGAGLGATSEYLASLITGQKPRSYDELLGTMRDQDKRASEANPGSYLAGQVAGGVGQGIGLARGGLSLTANAVKAGKGLAGVSKAAAIEGSLLGGAQGFGSGEGLEGRATGLGTGVMLGAGLGAALPSVTTAVGGAAKGLAAPFMAPFQPGKYTDRALSTYLKRSGKTPEEIASIMQAALDDGQGMYTVADAMGNAGQRALVPAVRTPNDARQEIVDQLVRRQLGQPQRLANFLSEGFDAPQTANQVERGLTDARNSQAQINYGAARRDAGAVNVTPVIEKLDETLQPGVNQIVNPGNNIAYDDIESALARVKSRITDGNSQITDFDALFRVKLNLDDTIARAEAQGAGNKVHALNEVKRRIDAALEDASSSFRNANDTYRAQSQVIDSIAEGGAAKSGRVRSADSIERFNGLPADRQQAFRVGYVDPIIADVESHAMGPATNRARSLTTPKYEQEFQAFAAPGEADRLGHRIGRENRMFETAKAAYGNSATADNLADIEDMSNFDPAIMANLLTGNWKQAAVTGVRQAFNMGKGLPPRVVERVGRNMMETDPAQALSVLGGVRDNRVSRDQLRAMILASMLQGTGSGVGRLP